jgi:hypothetical protein
MRTALFWVITRRLVVISYHYSPPKNPQERSSQLLRVVSQISRIYHGSDYVTGQICALYIYQTHCHTEIKYHIKWVKWYQHVIVFCTVITPLIHVSYRTTRSAQQFIGKRCVSLEIVLKISGLIFRSDIHRWKINVIFWHCQVHKNNSFSVNIHTHSCFINTRQEQRVFYVKTDIHLWLRPFHFFLEWEKFQTNVVEKSKHTFLYNFFFRKPRTLWGNVTLSDIIQMCTGLCLCVFMCDVHKKL